jgi:hypothetical protein
VESGVIEAHFDEEIRNRARETTQTQFSVFHSNEAPDLRGSEGSFQGEARREIPVRTCDALYGGRDDSQIGRSEIEGSVDVLTAIHLQSGVEDGDLSFVRCGFEREVFCRELSRPG